MVATPVYGHITLQSVDGRVAGEDISTTDVADGWVTFNNTGQKFFVMPFRGFITDVAMSGDGTDTKKWKVYVNGRDTGIGFRIAGVVNTVNNRVPTPVPIEKGSMVQLLEKA